MRISLFYFAIISLLSSCISSGPEGPKVAYGKTATVGEVSGCFCGKTSALTGQTLNGKEVHVYQNDAHPFKQGSIVIIDSVYPKYGVYYADENDWKLSSSVSSAPAKPAVVSGQDNNTPAQTAPVANPIAESKKVIIPQGGSLCSAMGVSWQEAEKIAKKCHLRHHWREGKLFIYVYEGDTFVQKDGGWTYISASAKNSWPM